MLDHTPRFSLFAFRSNYIANHTPRFYFNNFYNRITLQVLQILRFSGSEGASDHNLRSACGQWTKAVENSGARVRKFFERIQKIEWSFDDQRKWCLTINKKVVWRSTKMMFDDQPKTSLPVPPRGCTPPRWLFCGLSVKERHPRVWHPRLGWQSAEISNQRRNLWRAISGVCTPEVAPGGWCGLETWRSHKISRNVDWK